MVLNNVRNEVEISHLNLFSYIQPFFWKGKERSFARKKVADAIKDGKNKKIVRNRKKETIWVRKQQIIIVVLADKQC